MLGALMRAFKQKLEAEMAASAQQLAAQNAELEQFADLVGQRDLQVQTLTAKVERKKFKTAQTKTVLAQTQAQLTQLESKVSALDQAQADNEQLKSTLKVKRAGNIMLSAIMKAFRQKLEIEIATSSRALKDKSDEVR